MYLKYATAALAAAVPFVSAQTYTNCNPLKKTCPSDKGLSESHYYADFTKGESALDKWNTTAGKINFGDQGAEFTINEKGDAPTIVTDFYIFFGKVEFEMKASPGTGIVSTLVLQSDVLDEVDWEALGGDTTQIQTNYFGKGDTSSYDRGSFETVSTPQDTFHTYTVEYTKEKITWSIDGNAVRTVSYADAKGGSRYPQTPMQVKIGTWAGGDSGNAQGTIEWAGGQTDYSGGPYTMYIKSVSIENANPAEEYSYGDNSGSYESIKKEGGSDSDSSSSSSSSSDSSSSTTSSSSSSSSSTEASSTAAGSSSTPAGSSSASPSQTGSSSSSSGSGSGSSSGSSSGSGSGSGSGSSSSSAPSSSPSVFDGGASSTMGSSSLALVVLGFFTAMLQM